MWRVCDGESPDGVHRPRHSDPTAPAGQVMRTRRVPGSDIAGLTAPLPLEDRQEADLYTAYRASGVRLTDGQKDLVAQLIKTGDVAGAQKVVLDELAICLRNLATAINRRRASAHVEG